jgi:acetyl-CoA acyltransferase
MTVQSRASFTRMLLVCVVVVLGAYRAGARWRAEFAISRREANNILAPAILVSAPQGDLMPEAVIVSAVRTPVGRAYKGSLRATRPDDLAALAIKEALARAPGLDPKEIDDVILGCAMPEGEQGMNVARIAALRAGLPVETSAMTINRFCSSGLQAIALAAERIRGGSAEIIVAGGTESMSLVPMGGNKISPNPWLVDHYPDAYINMGLGTENIARKFGITREQADEFSANSHKKALAAIAAGNFKDETIPVEVKITSLPNGNGNGASSKSKSSPKPTTQTFVFDTDELPRAATSLEVLAKLKPAFHAKGTVTAGNSSPMSDGAAATVVMSDARAKALGLKPLARFVAYSTAGCPPEEFGMGPVFAIPKALKLAGLSLSDIAVIELNEAFGAQSLAVIQQAGLDAARVNPNGGAIALGHPLGCTGAKLTATLIRDLQRKNARFGMVTMCIGGGMGAAGIFERLS